MCLGMNPDTLNPGDRSASTSNRNFEGRQGKGGRTHLVSPAVAAATAIAGHFTTPEDLGDGLMEPVTVIEGTALPIDRSDVDTDQIIPAEYLKRIERTGSDRSCSRSGARIPDFVINDQRYANASILLAGENFGCGSSREHAPWAIEDAGFQAVIAPSFADIFRNNCTKIGLLPVELRAESVRALMDAVLDDPSTRIVVDLDALAVRAPGLDETFDMEDFTRWRLMEGLDDIGLTLRNEDKIIGVRGEPLPPGSRSPRGSHRGTRGPPTRTRQVRGSSSRCARRLRPRSAAPGPGSSAANSRLVAIGTVVSAVPWNTRNGMSAYASVSAR